MSFWYNEASNQMNTGALNMNSDSLSVYLVSSDYDTYEGGQGPRRQNVGLDTILSLFEISGAPGQGISTTIVKDDSGSPQGSRIIFDATVTWNNVPAAQQIKYVVLGRDRGGANDLLILQWELAPTSTTGGDVELTFNQTDGNAVLRTN